MSDFMLVDLILSGLAWVSEHPLALTFLLDVCFGCLNPNWVARVAQEILDRICCALAGSA